MRATEVQVAVGVQEALIAGPEPTVDEGRRVRLRVVFVAREIDVRSLDDDLALRRLDGR